MTNTATPDLVTLSMAARTEVPQASDNGCVSDGAFLQWNSIQTFKKRAF